MSEFSSFFAPRSIAIIGASREPGKLGHDVVRNLVQSGYQGAIYPVNPRADEILGHQVYSSIEAVPQPVDLSIIALPAPYVAQALEVCGKCGIAAAIVISGGFRETGGEGATLESELQQIAQRYGIALLGPNCIGTIDTHSPLNTTFITGVPVPGEIALMSQSGALVAAVLNWAEKSQVGFSRIASLGNQAGVTETDMLWALAHDPNTSVVTAYLEGISDGRAFLNTAMAVSPELPVIVLKAGRGSGAAKAAASHTGALAGSELAYDAAFRRGGILRASTLEELLDCARALATQPLPRANRVAVLTNAGGPGILAVDALEAAGMELAPLTSETRNHLRANLPPAASICNPVDILAGSMPPVYDLCLEALLKDKTVDAAVIITAPQDWFDPLDLARVIADLNESPSGHNKPILTCIMGPQPDSPAAALLRERRIPDFAFPERIGPALGAMWQRQQYLSTLKSETIAAPNYTVDRASAEAALAPSDSGYMGTEQVYRLLSAYGMTLPQQQIARNAQQAHELAEQIGYPLVMKLDVESISHKTEIGGILLDIESAEAASSAWDTLAARVPEGATFQGVLIQEMIAGQVEMIAGVTRDPTFGPLLMVGSGGTQAELLRDVAFEIVPISRHHAENMLSQTMLQHLLTGYRGQAPSDREAVIDLMLRLARIVLDFPQISEIEINPLIVRAEGSGAVAVDARVFLQDA